MLKKYEVINGNTPFATTKKLNVELGSVKVILLRTIISHQVGKFNRV